MYLKPVVGLAKVFIISMLLFVSGITSMRGRRPIPKESKCGLGVEGINGSTQNSTLNLFLEDVPEQLNCSHMLPLGRLKVDIFVMESSPHSMAVAHRCSPTYTPPSSHSELISHDGLHSSSHLNR